MNQPLRCLLLSGLFITISAHAEISEERIAADCANVKNLAAQGNTYYKAGLYNKAREQFEQQAAWSESCGLDESKIATAYNNVALTYIHTQQYLKARAWLLLLPKDKKSIYNLNLIQDQVQAELAKANNSPQGEYWHYSGKAMWDVITIKKAKQQFAVHFEGLYAGLMAMYSGPNLGEFSTTLDFKNGRARYSMHETESYLDCIFDFSVKNETLAVTLVSGEECGFGHNVSADGNYHRVGL